jgi:tRNA(His) 5'-end guanylyltransferase
MSHSDRRTIDAINDRMKAHERRKIERRAMRDVPLVVCVNGRSFSRFTRGMACPFDQHMADLMV